MTTRQRDGEFTEEPTQPVWPLVLLALVALPVGFAAFIFSLVMIEDNEIFGTYNPLGWIVPLFVGLLFAVPMLIGGIWTASRNAKANRAIRAARPTTPIGRTAAGQPIYPVVGYTPDGQAVTADRAVGVQSHVYGTNGLAISSLVTAFLVPLVGVILGHVAISQIRKTGQGGRGLALAGLIIGYVLLAVNIVAVIAFVTAARG